jgi:hypothetical protein
VDVDLFDSCVSYDPSFVTDLCRHRETIFCPDIISSSSDHKCFYWLAGKSADSQAEHLATFVKGSLIPFPPIGATVVMFVEDF